jgi:hypothetical protein
LICVWRWCCWVKLGGVGLCVVVGGTWWTGRIVGACRIDVVLTVRVEAREGTMALGLQIMKN